MSDSIDPEEILRAFAERWRQDQARGIERSLERYLEMFPGDARAIATELLALEDQARKAARQDTTTIGPYRTIRELGRGGHGSGVRGRADPRCGRHVALKVLTVPRRCTSHPQACSSASAGRRMAASRLVAPHEHRAACYDA